MKKIFTFCVSLLAALSVFAYDFQSGDLFYNITSSSAPYTVEVTRQSQFYYGNYSGVDTIVIPETVTYDSIIYSVTSIGAGAFDGCSSLTSITIPNGVTSIGERAFDGCDKLTSITIPNSVTSIGDWAFGSCRSLTSITLPNSVTSIGSHAFSNCFPLTSITIPNSVTSIGERAFDGCDKLTSMVVESGNIIYDSRENCDAIIETATNTLIAGCQNTIIPNSVTSIGDYAFDNCSSLTSIIIPNNVTSIGERAFADCSSLTSVTIGNSVTSIGEDAFSGCSSLTSMIVENGNTIYDSRENCNAIIETATNTLVAGCKNTIIPNSVTSIGDWAFFYCRSLISITIPNSVTSIGSHAFGSCYSLTSITLPNSVTSIGGGAFSFCSSLTSVTIGNSVTSIGGEAFPYCSSLTSITIPESVTSIGDRAFSGCDSLISIVVEDGNATYDSRTNCNAIIETATNTLIAGCQNTIIPNSVTSIGSHAFSDCSSLTSITIPNSVTSIGSHAFGSCSSLTSITIPNSVTSIGKYAFNECSSLNTIYVESATPSVLGEFALARPICVIPCGSLAAYKSSAWSEQVGSFKEDCVEGYQITTYTSTDGNIVTPNKTDVFGTNIISNTYVNGVGRLYFDGIVTSIGDSAFYNCETLSSITLPETVTLLGYGSFDDCTSLTKIRVKATTQPKILGGYTFHNAPLDTCLIPCGTLDAYQSSDWAQYVGEFVEVCPAVVKAKVPASWENDEIMVWVWTDGEGTEYPTTKDGDWYVYTHSDAEEFNIIFKSGTGWKGNTYQTVDINGITENTCLEIQPTTGKATYTIVDCPSIIYELNGGVTNDYGWQSKGAVALELQNDYNAAYGTSKEWAKSENGYIYYKLGEEWVREDLVPAGTDCKTAGFIAYVTYNNSDNFKNLFAANPDKYGWLNDIIIATRTAAGLSVDEASMAEIIYRYELSAFFLCSPERTSWPGTSSYEVAGTFESFKTIWKQAFANPTNPAEEFVLNAPYKEGYTFAGWYTTPDFSGEKVTTINAETEGTLYAKWIDETWVIKYTSTDGNIVTPYATDVFGANIVNNTYEDGVGTLTFDGAVTSIGDSAFYECSGMALITIPNSVTSIGDKAFALCNALASITIPNSVTSIGNYAFYYCSSLTSITIPDSVTSIGHHTFYRCSNLISITIPYGVTSIGQHTFYNCSKLTSITIPNGVISIGLAAFNSCSGLTSIAIPNSVTSIGYAAFNVCPSLASMVVEQSNTTYDSRNNCNAIIETATNTLVAGCQNTIIPNSVTSIGGIAFGHCYSLTSITIPNSVTSIGGRAFSNCSSLDTIHVEATTPPALEDSTVFRNTPSPVCVIPCGTFAAYEASDWAQYVSEFVEEGCEEPVDPTWQITYTSTDGNIVTPNDVNVFGANIVNNTYEDGQGVITFDGPVTSIGDSAFYYCTSLASITIPESVTSIGEDAFYGCSSLTSITIPESVTSIGKMAFHYCFSLTSITIPNSVTSIGYLAFWDCTSLTSITIPESVTSIGYQAFSYCTSLTSMVVEPGNTTYDSRENCNAIIEKATNTLIAGCKNTIIPNTVTSIGEDAFYGCSSLTSITIPNSVNNIEMNAFVACSSLTSITIPNSVTSIGGCAFSSCTSLTSLTIPESVTSIGEVAFAACSSLTSIVVEPGNTTYDSRENCNAIIEKATNTLIAGCQNTVIPNTVTSIGNLAFFYCESLTSATIGSGVTSIGNRAFEGCSSLASITIPNSVTSIGWWAFKNCVSLDTIYVGATIPPTLGSSNVESSDVFSGSPISTCYIPCGTLDAYESSAWADQVGKFVEECVEGQQIYYTSTDGNIVTPNDVNVFGANIVSNTYQDGQGVITFDGPVTKIGDLAFQSCIFLKSITISNTVTSIGKNAFNKCHNLNSITIPNGVISIESRSFAHNTSLTSIVIPSSVKSIGDYAFNRCTSLSSIFIPNSVTNIGCRTFAGCYGLISMIVENGNMVYDSRENCNAIIETATNTLISGCQNTIIPESVMSIGDYAFDHCCDLTSISIPSNVLNIGDYAFENCHSLSSVFISNSVTTIGKMAFQYCSSLDTIHVKATTPPALEDSTVFMNTPAPICVIPCGTLAAYEASDWASQVGGFVEDCVEGQQIYYTSTNDSIVTPYNVNAFDANIVSNVYENGVGTITFDAPLTRIGTQAFHDCFTLTSIIVPNSVKIIGNAAFSGTYLESVVIGSGVTSIGEDVFGGCGLLTSIVVDTNNTTFDSREDCNAIIKTSNNILVAGCKTTIIPNTIKGIGNYAFAGSWEMTSIEISDGVETIGSSAFGGCTVLRSVMLPNSLVTIGDDAFSTCPALTSITIPSSVKRIGADAFWCDYALDTLYVEATTPPTLGYKPFYNAPVSHCFIPCGTLSAYEASAWASQVGEFVEEGCAPIQMCGDDLYWEYADGVLTITGTGDMYDYAADTDVPWYDVRGNIKTVILPDAMTKIGQNAFYKCINMTTINMPASLISVGEKAFAQDTKLACEIILPASMTNIASRAFFNCKAVPAFHVEATTPPTVQADAFDYTTAPIHVPCGYGHIYGKHTQWGMLNLEMCELLQDNVYYYPIDGHTARAVTYHSNPTDTLVIPSAVVIDGMPRTVTEVADFAFTDCDNLPAIYFNEGLEYIGERAFVRCYGLQGTIVLPATLETIGERAFSYCDNVEKYLLQAMTPPVLGADVFTGNNKNALFYISCEAMDDYKVATNWSSLKSRLRDACLNIYHYNTPFPLGTNGVYTTEDTLVASIYYRRRFTPYRWETLYLPFEVDRVTVLEDGVEYDLTAWDIVNGGHYFLAKPDGMLNKEILFGFTDELESHTPYIIQFSDAYYTDKLITFYGKESWNKLSTSFEVLSSSAWMQIAGNTTLQDQLLEKPVYMLRSGLDFILQKTTTTLHPFECYVMPYTAQSGAPARMSVRLRDDVATAVESMKGNESRLAYTINGNTLTVYPQGQAFSIYSLNGALIYSCEAGKEAVDCELNSGCYLLHAGTEAHKIML